MSPISGGTWSVLLIYGCLVNNAGLVTGLGSRYNKICFYQYLNRLFFGFICSFDGQWKSKYFNLIGPGNICMGQSSQLSPTVVAHGCHLQPTIASVSNTGLVTGISSGKVSCLQKQAAAVRLL
ncbi:MAG: hypothetical protein IPN49_13305 [Saprospiraceae bacterium]|nr:hypothetical protein [Saprospiraceae bacterium]